MELSILLNLSRIVGFGIVIMAGVFHALKFLS